MLLQQTCLRRQRRISSLASRGQGTHEAMVDYLQKLSLLLSLQFMLFCTVDVNEQSSIFLEALLFIHWHFSYIPHNSFRWCLKTFLQRRRPRPFNNDISPLLLCPLQRTKLWEEPMMAKMTFYSANLLEFALIWTIWMSRYISCEREKAAGEREV